MKNLDYIILYLIEYSWLYVMIGVILWFVFDVAIPVLRKHKKLNTDNSQVNLTEKETEQIDKGLGCYIMKFDSYKYSEPKFEYYDTNKHL